MTRAACNGWNAGGTGGAIGAGSETGAGLGGAGLITNAGGFACAVVGKVIVITGERAGRVAGADVVSLAWVAGGGLGGAGKESF